MSLEAAEVKGFVEKIRLSESALGDPRVIFSSRVNNTMRRSLQGRVAPKGLHNIF